MDSLLQVLERNDPLGVTVIKASFTGLPYEELHCGSFELLPNTFQRSDPDMFEFKFPTAVDLHYLMRRLTPIARETPRAKSAFGFFFCFLENPATCHWAGVLLRGHFAPGP